ncbi:TonB-dependent receptor domain-containing protein [Novilysobacter avium]|uniref:TonB-dependent receptor n=1 Tax=Novilysobacter avium TaxID=2781023 RepID=A0A7S6UM45_9GAMM|nr:TonB-dependent receptor [Lysobacter avium]QOW22770.1 TonB-dependent receptor [Lysobacter avium]
MTAPRPTRSIAPLAHHRRAGLGLALLLALSSPVIASAATGVAGDAATAGPIDLDAVVVTAAGFEQMVREAPASITVLTREELVKQPIHSLADALVNVEGVDIGVGVDKTGAPQISLRGMPSSYTLVLIDGRRQNTSGNVAPNNFGNTANNFIPPMSAIDRIEVIRGPMSTLYGSDAMGGVINIITRKVGAAWAGSVGMETSLQEDSSFGNLYGANFFVDGPLVRDLLGLSLRGGWFKRDASDIAYTDLSGEEIVPWMGANPVSYDSHNVGARLALTPSDDHDLWLDVTSGRQEYDNSTGQMGTLGAGGYAPSLRFNRDQATLAWDARYDLGALESSLQQTTTETIGRLLPAGTAGAGSPRELENRNRVFDTKLVTDIGSNKLTVGGQYLDAKLVDGVASDAFEFHQWALFAENEWSINDALNLTVGARHDDHSTFGSHLSPRAYLVWNANANWVVKGGYSEGYRSPNIEDLTPGIKGFGGQGTIPLIGTPTLKPETSATTELGVYYAADNGFSSSLTVFNNDFSDKIASGTPVANCAFGLSQAAYNAADFSGSSCVDVGWFPRSATLGQTVNIDKAVTRGAEFAMQVPLAEAWKLQLNYTRTDSEQKSGSANGTPLTNTPRNLLNGSVNWQATDALALYLRGEYRSARYRGAGAAQDQLGDYKSYSQFHLGGRYRVSDAISLNAAVYNLFDKDFVDYLPYDDNGTVAYANTRSTSEAGRRLWLSVNVDF